MIPVKLADPGTKVDIFAMTGGLDLVTPALSIPSGALIGCQNYEPDLNGGYRRSGTYERFDGHPRPSDVSYYSLACTVTGTIVAGDLVEVGAASGTYVAAIADGILLANPTGTFAASTAMTVSAVGVGTTAADPASTYGDTALEEAQALSDCADQVRTDIAAVPGSGSVLGVFMFNGVVYALRNNVGDTAAVLHKSTASGWSAITLPYEISFTTTGSTPIVDGETITGAISGATGVVRRVVLETSEWGGAPAGTGRLILTGIVGTFQSAETVTGGTSTGTATTSSVATQITLTKDGSLRTIQYNFGGYSGDLRVYGADGVNRPWEFDGNYLVPLNTGVPGVFPSRLVANRRYLYLAYGGSVLYSVVDDPYRWSATLGAGEIAVGDDVTNLVALPGEAVGIFSRNKTQALVGASPSEWSLQTIAADVGAIADTVQTAIETYALDDRGVINLQASQNYGNFSIASASRKVQPLINQLRGTIVCSSVVRERSLYRLFSSTGTVLSMLPGKNTQFGTLELGVPPTCIWSGEDTTGVERTFFGAANGFVYEMNVGTSQDGTAVEAFLRTAFVHEGMPRIRKRYRLLALDVAPDRYMTIAVGADLSYGDQYTPSVAGDSMTAGGAGGFWNIANWDEFFWDGAGIDQPQIKIEGVGVNLSISIYQNTTLDAGHVIQTALIHWTPRRMKR